jgi:prophage regulatory protein
MRYLRLSEVIARTSLSRSEIYRRIAAGKFPRQKRLSPRVSVWLDTEIDAWMGGDGELDQLLGELIG